MNWKHIKSDVIARTAVPPSEERAPVIITYASGAIAYYVDGGPRGEDGPAITLADGKTFYWHSGVYYPNIPNDQHWIKLCKLKAFW